MGNITAKRIFRKTA